MDIVNTSIILLCRHGGRINRDLCGKSVGYVGGTCVLTKAPSKRVSVSELRQIVCKAFGWNYDEEGEMELSWKMLISGESDRYELVTLDTPVSLETSLEYFESVKMSKFFEIIVTKRRSNEVDGALAENPIFIKEEEEEVENVHSAQIQGMTEGGADVLDEGGADVLDGGVGVDYIKYFNIQIRFDSVDQAFSHANGIAVGLGFYLVKASNHTNKKNGAIRNFVKCDRFGKFKSKANPNTPSPRKSRSTKKCNCPFAIKIVQELDSGLFVVKPKCGLHNHDFN